MDTLPPSLNRRFRLVLRPLRAPDGPREERVVEARTASQAKRLAVRLFPEHKLVGVTREARTPAVAVREEPAEPAEPVAACG